MTKTNLHPLTNALRTALAQAGDKEHAPQMQAYMKSEMPFKGVRGPVQKQIFQDVFKQYPLKSFDEYELIIRELWNASYREERYGALVLARRYKKFQIMGALPIYRMLIETGAWWDFVDLIASHLIVNLLKKYPSEMKNILHEWITDENLWIRRSAILSQLFFKKDTDAEMLLSFCSACIDENVFWIQKAIGWALRQYSKVESQIVRQYVEANRERLSKVSLREAVKYI